MLKLLTCAQGHFWEKPAEGENGQSDRCPVCGQEADAIPLLDLAPAEAAPVEVTADPTPPPLRDKDERPAVAGYEIQHDLGKGPTGVHLYRARQLLVNRLVALKVVFAKDDPSQIAWGSLRNEAGALGRLAHPNIVQILEAGERDRQMFYNAVEHVDGPTLAETLEGKPLPIRHAVAFVEALARAMHHAHEKNILHRNLKPASILLASGVASAPREAQSGGESAPSLAQCVPKITDFGLARRPLEGDTSDGELQGEWPYYLAPEQAWGRAKEIGPATDIYALGAILHELLTGRPPFRAETPAETLDAIQCREVPPLNRLRRGLPRDLDAICRKCLAKQPRRRYASALELADDLRRFADRYPIKARLASNTERFGKWLRRNFRTVAFVLLGLWACVSLLILFSGSAPPRDAARPSREGAFRNSISQLETELTEARRHQTDSDYLQYLFLAERALTRGQRERIDELLNRCPVEARRWEWHYLHGRAKGEEMAHVFETEMPVAGVDLSRDGVYLAAGGGEVKKPPNAKGEVFLWNLPLRQRARHWTTATPVRGVAFDEGATHVALVCNDEPAGESEVQVRRVLTGQILDHQRYPGRHLNSIAYSVDQSNLLLAGGDATILSMPPNQLGNAINNPVAFPQPWRIGATHARLLPLPPDPARFALVSPDGGQVVIVEQLRPGISHPLRGSDTTLAAVAFDPQHQTLATAGRDGVVGLWDVSFPYQSKGVLRGPKTALTGIAFNSDGTRLASCAADGVVRIWDAVQRTELVSLQENYRGASGVFFNRPRGWQADRLAIVHGNKITVLEPSPGIVIAP